MLDRRGLLHAVSVFALILAGGPAVGRAQGAPPQPCKAEPESAQLDFWLGEWEVSNRADGRVVGHNRIEALEGGCLLVESYTTDRGYAGKSMSFYDKVLGQWRQLWVDNSGTIMEFQGNFRDGSMRFEGEQKSRDGSRARLKMTFTPEAEGTVRQLIEQSGDGGKTWTVSFDGRYVKRKA